MDSTKNDRRHANDFEVVPDSLRAGNRLSPRDAALASGKTIFTQRSQLISHRLKAMGYKVHRRSVFYNGIDGFVFWAEKKNG